MLLLKVIWSCYFKKGFRAWTYGTKINTLSLLTNLTQCMIINISSVGLEFFGLQKFGQAVQSEKCSRKKYKIGSPFATHIRKIRNCSSFRWMSPSSPTPTAARPTAWPTSPTPWSAPVWTPAARTPARATPAAPSCAATSCPVLCPGATAAPSPGSPASTPRPHTLSPGWTRTWSRYTHRDNWK